MNMTTLAGLVLPALLLAGCGEYPQQVPYENGGYQGKRDTRMWDSAAFGHDPQQWQQAIGERAQKQHEYNRTGRYQEH